MRPALCMLCLAIGLCLFWRSLGREQRDPISVSWLAKIDSADAGEGRIAQAQLAHRGAMALPEMARNARNAAPSHHKRLQETTALMLLKSITPEQLFASPVVAELCAKEIKQARVIAQPLANATGYDSGEHGLMAPGTKPPPLSLPRQAVQQLVAQGGFAVPAALDLCADASPHSRMYGVELLFALEASGQLAILKKMTLDEGKLSIFHGDYSANTTVGKEAAMRLHNASTINPDIPGISWKPATEAEGYVVALERLRTGAKPVQTDLVNRLRQEAKTYDAVSWDDYWQRALPILKKAWKR